jgi:hypothetical protein
LKGWLESRLRLNLGLWQRLLRRYRHRRLQRLLRRLRRLRRLLLWRNGDRWRTGRLGLDEWTVTRRNIEARPE